MSFKEWKTYKLGEICVIKGGKRLPKGEPYSLNTTKYPYIRLVDVENGKVSKNNIQYLNEKTQSLISRYIVEDGDVCLAIVGNTIGVVFYIDEQLHGANLTENAARLTLFKDTYSKYVYYFLLSQEGQNEIYKNAIGSAQGKLPIYGIQNIDIPLPKYSTQIKVGNILSSLDDKIELNRQTNQTLEGIAQTLFQEMCVPKGEELPEGWRVGKLGEIMESKGGTTPSTKNEEFWNGEYNWVTPKDLSNKIFPVLLSSERTITEKGLKQISSGLLPKGTLLMSSRAPIGYFAISQIPVAINQGFIAINGKSVSNLFLLYYLRSNIETIKGMANGSTFLEISKSVFRGIEIVIPPNSVLEKFDFQVKPIFEQIVSNEQETQTLIALRDSLLPKLMKGEIEI